MTSTPLEALNRLNQTDALLEKMNEAARIAREAEFRGVAWRLAILAEEVVLLKHGINPYQRHGR